MAARSRNQDAVAQLHRSRDAAEPLGRVGEQRLVLGGGQEPARILQQDAAELAGLVQRVERVEEVRPHRVEQLGRGDPSRRCAPSPRRRRAAPRRASAGRRATSVGWPVISACAFTWKLKSAGVRSAQSARDGALGERVVARVHLDHGELRGVVAQPVLGRRDAARIEHAAAHHRRVGPRRGADADLVVRRARSGGPPVRGGVAAAARSPRSDAAAKPGSLRASRSGAGRRAARRGVMGSVPTPCAASPDRRRGGCPFARASPRTSPRRHVARARPPCPRWWTRCRCSPRCAPRRRRA